MQARRLSLDVDVNSFPEGGPYILSFSGTQFVNYYTSGYFDPGDYSLINGSITVVPESSTVVAAVFTLLFAGFHTLRQATDKSEHLDYPKNYRVAATQASASCRSGQMA